MSPQDLFLYYPMYLLSVTLSSFQYTLSYAISFNRSLCLLQTNKLKPREFRQFDLIVETRTKASFFFIPGWMLSYVPKCHLSSFSYAQIEQCPICSALFYFSVCFHSSWPLLWTEFSMPLSYGASSQGLTGLALSLVQADLMLSLDLCYTSASDSFVLLYSHWW